MKSFLPKSLIQGHILKGIGLGFLILFFSSPSAFAETNRYFYDDLGRLIGVMDSGGNSSVYRYDSVGNLLEITQHLAGELAVFSI